MYTTEIITLLSWPVLIVVSYFTAVFFVKKYEQKEEGKDSSQK